MGSLFKTLTAAAVGAAAMYYFDSQSGRRRRAMLRDRMGATSRTFRKKSRAQARKAMGHAYGMLHRAASSGAPVSDVQVTERVRSHLGRVMRTPGAVDVRVDHGVACVAGEVLASDRQRVIDEIAAVPGVERVEDHLSVHAAPGNIPELQGVAQRSR
ncbi:BON domain-containing protein [Paraburkholderia phymatum]|uniref:Transport-associated n=1 Tax=Paraburkholderia phymatum (strain DSM 17167 / CIP 108236 / LMG 21445 / STM815) TaxID=391038 RepID=B2JLF4_PARP8|nr:BON domain-containing protein [Paraburkholderia phymatum]ACC74122.1 transport-associated [Paraburkholderia phymatum STM815]